MHLIQTVEKMCVSHAITFGFGLASHWMKIVAPAFEPIKWHIVVQNPLLFFFFDIKMKTALRLVSLQMFHYYQTVWK